MQNRRVGLCSGSDRIGVWATLPLMKLIDSCFAPACVRLVNKGNGETATGATQTYECLAPQGLIKAGWGVSSSPAICAAAVLSIMHASCSVGYGLYWVKSELF